MITAKLLFQTIAGFTLLGSVVGGSYMMISTVENEYKYLIVVSGEITTPEKDLITSVNNIVAKKYQCKLTETIFDEDCEIFKINDEETEKTIDFEKLNADITKLKVKEDLKVSKHYVLKVNKTKYNSQTNMSKIALVSSTGKAEVKYSDLTIKKDIGKDLTKIKTNLVIAQAVNLTSASSTKTTTDGKFNCLIEGIKEGFACSVYKPSTEKASNDYAVSDFSSITAITTAGDVKDKKYFVLDLKDKQFTKEELRNKKITLNHVANTGSAVSHIADFVFDQVVLGDLNGTAKFGYPVSPSNEIYYVSKLIDNSVDAQITKDLYDSNVVKTKNFKCKLPNVTSAADEDITCEIFALPAFDPTNKSIKFTDIQTAKTTITEKTKLTAGKYFKLKINKTNMSNLNWTKTADITIDIVSTTETNKKYASLKLFAKEEKEKLQGQTSFVVGKASGKTGSETTAATFKCKIGDAGSDADCDVYKFTSALGQGKTYNDLNLSAISKSTAENDIVNDSYYLIDLKTNKYDLITDLNKLIVVTNNSKSFNLTINSPITGKIGTAMTDNEFIFLK